jgi:N-acetylmuramoyl-L-alanine amidase
MKAVLTGLSVLLVLVPATMIATPPAAAGSLDGVKICVDPGHPSENGAGCTGAHGTKEYKITWVVGQRLAKLLRDAGATVVLTKSSEGQTVTNRRRAEIANEARVDLAVRLHCDSGGSSGFAFYYPDRQGTVQGVTGPSESVRRRSKLAAYGVYPQMKEKLAGYLPGRGLHGDSETDIGGRQGALTGSIFSHVPVFTIEMCMLTRAADEEFISSSSGKWKMAGSIKAGIVAYLGHEEQAQAAGPVAASGAESPSPAALATAPVTVAPPAASPPASSPVGGTPPVSSSPASSVREQSVAFLRWWAPAVVGAWAVAMAVWLLLRRHRAGQVGGTAIGR